jgi:Flavin containing amine oxidoreductase
LTFFDSAYQNTENEAEENYENSEQPGFVDNGVLALLSNNGWAVAAGSTGNMDYVFQWLYIDFEYAAADTSVRYFPYIDNAEFLVHDQRGYQSVLETFKNENIGDNNIRYNSRVVAIDYNVDICSIGRLLGLCFGKRYKAVVRTNNGLQFRAQRVISTVSAGVLNSGNIQFTPKLKYKESPYYMAQFIKVFYQFQTKFWDNTPFIYTIRDVDNRGKCHNWQDMDFLIPGSRIIRCELMTEAFLDLIDEDTKSLSDDTLLSLLEPLRVAYGNESVGTPIAMYYPKINLDPNFGYGAYANWKIGSTLVNFANYFGGVPNLVNKCDHNGCNADRDWIVHLSGSASCYEHAEYVHGAYFAGQRSARFVLDSLGVEGVETDNSECDVSFPEVIYDLPEPEDENCIV